jgi:hypothetical protein
MHRLLLALSLASCASACAHQLHAQAQAQAAVDMRCQPPLLRVRPVGVLQGRGARPTRVSVFDAEGCDAARHYFCADGKGCRTTLEALLSPSEREGLSRASRLLVTQTRGRCPGDTQQVVQESASLFVLSACDGEWEYLCRAAGCERLR